MKKARGRKKIEPTKEELERLISMRYTCYMTLEECAKRFSVSAGTLERWLKERFKKGD